jgi:hypothetical protein
LLSSTLPACCEGHRLHTRAAATRERPLAAEVTIPRLKGEAWSVAKHSRRP